MVSAMPAIAPPDNPAWKGKKQKLYTCTCTCINGMQNCCNRHPKVPKNSVESGIHVHVHVHESRSMIVNK